MAEGYFNPWRGAIARDCRTCRYSIGTPDGWHLWCERHRLVVVFPCGLWEREAGADDPLRAEVPEVKLVVGSFESVVITSGE